MEMMSLKCAKRNGAFTNCMVDNEKVIAFQGKTGRWFYPMESMNCNGISINWFQTQKNYLLYSDFECQNYGAYAVGEPLIIDNDGSCGFYWYNGFIEE